MKTDKEKFLKRVAEILGCRASDLVKAVDLVEKEIEAEDAKAQVAEGLSTSDKFDDTSKLHDDSNQSTAEADYGVDSKGEETKSGHDADLSHDAEYNDT